MFSHSLSSQNALLNKHVEINTKNDVDFGVVKPTIDAGGDMRDVLVLECANYETALRNERLLQAVFFEHNVNYRTDGKWRRSDWFNNLPFANNAVRVK